MFDEEGRLLGVSSCPIQIWKEGNCVEVILSLTRTDTYGCNQQCATTNVKKNSLLYMASNCVWVAPAIFHRHLACNMFCGERSLHKISCCCCRYQGPRVCCNLFTRSALTRPLLPCHAVRILWWQTTNQHCQSINGCIVVCLFYSGIGSR